MDAPPPPPGVAAATVSAQNPDTSGAVTCPKHISGAVEIVGQRTVCIERHVSVPCDSSASSVDILSHSLPRLTSKTALPTDKMVLH